MLTKFFGVLRSHKLLLTIGLLALVLLGYAASSTTVAVIFNKLTPPKLPTTAAASKQIALDQNWSDETRARFHHMSQGTSTFPVPAAWMMALEQPEASPWGLLIPRTRASFMDTGHLRRFGFIPSSQSAYNSLGLPVGFATTKFQNLAGISATSTSIGLTCAACHTGHFEYEGTEFVVDGGPSTIDLDAFSGALGAALGQTLMSATLPVPNRRFTRFATRVLGQAADPAAKAQLKADLEAALLAAPSDQFNVLEGHGRLDALNRIGNQVFAENVNRPDNYTPISAPVNFPHIWTAMWFSWVQYDGSIMQPLVRNSGEALGVHAHVNMTAPKDQGRFSAAIPVDNLNWIETTLAGKTHPQQAQAFGGLNHPKWPDALPPLDAAKVDAGRQLYGKHCAGCHLPELGSDKFWRGKYFRKITYQKDGQMVETNQPYLDLHIIPLRALNTDPGQSEILLKRTVNTAGNEISGAKPLGLNTTVCAPRKVGPGAPSLVETPVTDGPQLNFGLALGALVEMVNTRWFDNNGVSDKDRAGFQGGRPNCLQARGGYKARPLNGVWATSPFLHNGSVPTLDDLLRPVDERPRFVQLGSLAFDAEKVGVKQPNLTRNVYPAYRDGFFILDTSLAGNRNTGHAFGVGADGDKKGVIGPHFSDTERAALIEFLKSY